jgi:hypothetical protein
MADDVLKNLFAVQKRRNAEAAAKQTKTRQRTAQKPVTVRPATGGVSGGGGGGQSGSGYASNHDCGPWIEAPNSSRVREYRYDYGNGQLQVVWGNSRGYHGNKTLYQCGDEATGKGGTHVYRAFAQAVSKGKYVNNVLDDIPFWPGDDASFNAPTNPNRNAVRHKL